MKKISIYLGVLIGLTVFLSSCKDKEHDTNNVLIEISAPTPGAMYNNGDTVLVNATITSDVAMHGWNIFIRNKSDQTEVYSTDAHEHAATYHISTYWVNNVQQHTEMELEVVATVDHNGTTANKKVTFHCHE